MTTNFDRLLERAFPADLLDVFTAPQDFRRQPQKPCALYKVHGSVDDVSTLVDTVSQKLRGPAFPVRTRLAELFREHHVLVVGFSGADLDFGSDYLALSSLKTRRTRRHLDCAAGRRLRARAEELIDAVGRNPGSSGSLARYSRASARTIQNGAEAGEATQDGGQREVDRRTRAYVGDWLKSLGDGSVLQFGFLHSHCARPGLDD